MSERPVTGSCERCARRFDLLIPEPGSRDLDFNRIEALFRYCGHCGRLVGRACCWDPAARACHSCRARVVDGARAGSAGELAVARGELRAIDDAIVRLADIDARLASLEGRAGDARTRADDPLDAWEDAWLATGALMSRVESLGEAVAARLTAPPVAPSAAQQMRAELRRRATVYEARVRRLSDHLVRLGRSLRRSRTAPPAPTDEEQRVPVPIISDAVAEAVPVTGVLHDLRLRRTASWSDSSAGREAIRRHHASGGRRALVGAPSAEGATATAPPPRASNAPGAARRARGLVDDRPLPAAAPRSAAPNRPAPEARTDREGPNRVMAPSRPARWAHVAAAAGAAFAVAALAVGAALVLAALNGLGGFADRQGIGDGDGRPVGTAGPSTPGRPAAATTTPPEAAAPSPLAHELGFDTKRLGALEADGVDVVSVVGDPQIVAFPSPFDRAVQLSGAPSGFCAPAAGLRPAIPADVSFDVSIRTAGSNLTIAVELFPDAAAASMVRIDVADLGLDPAGTWYRAELAWDGAGVVDVMLVQRDTGAEATYEATLEAVVADEPPGISAMACLMLHGSGEGELLVDNVRITQ